MPHSVLLLFVSYTRLRMVQDQTDFYVLTGEAVFLYTYPRDEPGHVLHRQSLLPQQNSAFHNEAGPEQNQAECGQARAEATCEHVGSQ